MFRKDLNPLVLADSYAAAEPFPHAVIDNFLEAGFAAELADQLERVDVGDWQRGDHPDQVNKWWMSDVNRLSRPVAEALLHFNSPEALGFFEKLTGIGPLHPDVTYLGGGVHISGPGGRLGVHADFNLHPTTGLHRRLNALLFLNREWESDWNGDLELYDESLTSPVRTIAPLFNQLAIFNVTDRSFHGVPKIIACPPDRRRISLALYYYTTDRPEHEKAPFHWAAWQRTTHS